MVSGGVYDGVVAAPMIEVRSPSSGKLSWIAGENARLISGQVIGEFAVSDQDVEAIRAQIEALETIRISLAHSAETFAQSRVALLENKVAEAEAASAILQIDLEEAQRKSAAMSRLARSGAQSKDAAISQEAVVRRLKLQLQSSRHAIETAKVELEAARKGSFVSEGYNDVPFSAQREVDVDLRIAELRRELMRIRLTNDNGNQSPDGRKLYAPTNGVVMSANIIQGQAVEKGLTLLSISNCDRLFVNVSMPASRAENLAEGAAVELTMSGSNDVFTGRVQRLIADGSVARPSAIDSNRYEVLVEVLSEDMKTSCPVGRRVTASFNGGGINAGEYLSSMLSILPDSFSFAGVAEAEDTADMKQSMLIVNKKTSRLSF